MKLIYEFMMASSWNDKSCGLLIDLLREKEHLYNRSHPNYKTYTVITECTEFGKSLTPTLSCKSVLDKITLFRKEFLKATEILDNGNSENVDIWPYYEKCYFMYSSLVQNSSGVSKRKALTEHSNNESTETKKERKEEIFKEPFISSNEEDKNEEKKGAIQLDDKNKHQKSEILKQNPTRDVVDTDTRTVIDFIRDKPFLYDLNHPMYGKNTKMLSDFAKTLKTPKSELQLRKKILNLKNNFLRSFEKTNNKKCAWFDECRFFINYFKSKTVTKTLNSTINYKTKKHLRKFKLEDNSSEFLNFLRENPFLYIKKHPYFKKKSFKRHIMNEFAKNLNPPVSIRQIVRKIEYYQRQLRSNPKNWYCLKDCKFILDSYSGHISPKNQILYEDFQKNKEIKLGSKNFWTNRIINFLRDKPYMFDMSHPDFEDINKKYKECFLFAKKYPTISVDTIVKKIIHIRNQVIETERLLKESNNDPTQNWRWYDDCIFLHNTLKNCDHLINGLDLQFGEINVHVKDIIEKNSIRLLDTLEYQHSENIEHLIEIVTFVEDNPIFYDKNHPDYENYCKKYAIKEKFVKLIKSELSENQINKLIDSTIKKISNHNMKKDDVNFEYIDVDVDNFTPIDLNNISIITSKKEKILVDSSVQCNLYEELWQEKIMESEIFKRDCNCIESFNEIMKPTQSLREKPINFIKKNEIDTDYEQFYNDSNQECNTYTSSDVINEPLDDWPVYTDTKSSSEDEETFFFPKYEVNKIEVKHLEQPDGTYVCEKCSRKCTTGSAIRTHLRTHDDTSLLCMKCGKMNKNTRKLKMHELYCDLDKQKYCYECDNIFKSHILYYDHINMDHEKTKPYICASKHSFSCYSRFITHMNKYSCCSIDECTIPDYITKEFLASFIEIAHYDDEDYENKIKKTKFWCRICKINYVVNQKYMKHFKSEFHLEAENYWIEKFNIKKIFFCEFCPEGDSKFDNISDLVHHRHGIHHKCTLDEYFSKLERSTEKALITINEPMPSEYSKCLSTCRICMQEFFFKEFKNHFQTDKHLKMEKLWIARYKIEKFVCQICFTEFEKLLDFVSHQYDEHSIWPINKNLKELQGTKIKILNRVNCRYYCSLCDEDLRSRRHSYDHISMHKNEKPYFCTCEKSFRYFKAFCMHIRNRCPENNGHIPSKYEPLDWRI